MHICLDFAPELLRQADLEKQAFAVNLISHLSVQYALPKSFSTARLAINVLSTLLSGMYFKCLSNRFPRRLQIFELFSVASSSLHQQALLFLSARGVPERF